MKISIFFLSSQIESMSVLMMIVNKKNIPKCHYLLLFVSVGHKHKIITNDVSQMSMSQENL